MNILMLADVFFPDTIGGAGRVAYHLSNELSSRQHKVHVITRNPGNRLASSESINPGLHIHRFFVPDNGSLSLIINEIKNTFSLIKRLSAEIHFDVVCIHQSLAALGPTLSVAMKGIPIIYYFHSPWHEEFIIKKGGRTGLGARLTATVMRSAEKWIVNRSSRVIVLSKYMSGKVMEIHKYPEVRIRLIPGGVDLEKFRLPSGGKEAIKKELQMPLDKTIFLTVRNLVPRMGLENLLEAFGRSELLSKRSLLLMGGSGFLGDRLRAIADSYNLGNVVRFLGHIPGEILPGMYQAADYFVLPTEKLEGFGLVIAEAMACGTPVLGTPVGAIEEVIGQFNKKLVFSGTGWRDLKNKLEEVIEQPAVYKFDGQSIRNFVEDRYSWAKVADAFEREVQGIFSS